MFPSGTTRIQLDAALTEAAGGLYILEDGSDNPLNIDGEAIVGSDVVVSFAEDGTTEVTYTIVVTP